MNNRYLHTIRVKFDDGDELVTRINGSKDDVLWYYSPGNVFNTGTYEDHLVRVTELEFLD